MSALIGTKEEGEGGARVVTASFMKDISLGFHSETLYDGGQDFTTVGMIMEQSTIIRP